MGKSVRVSSRSSKRAGVNVDLVVVVDGDVLVVVVVVVVV